MYRYGGKITPTITDTNPYRYAGEYYDLETGFIYLRARYYDPTLGRFISEDPICDGINWYSYCAGDPVNFVDPWGEDAIVLHYEDAAAGFGHDSLLIQKDKEEEWVFFYWGAAEEGFWDKIDPDGAVPYAAYFNLGKHDPEDMKDMAAVRELLELHRGDLDWSEGLSDMIYIQGDFEMSAILAKKYITIINQYRRASTRIIKTHIQLSIICILTIACKSVWTYLR